MVQKIKLIREFFKYLKFQKILYLGHSGDGNDKEEMVKHWMYSMKVFKRNNWENGILHCNFTHKSKICPLIFAKREKGSIHLLWWKGKKGWNNQKLDFDMDGDYCFIAMGF